MPPRALAPAPPPARPSGRPTSPRLLLAAGAALGAATLGLVAGAHAGRPAAEPAQDPGIGELAWLAGAWRTELAGGQVVEERWDPPHGNCMTGTLRWLREGAATMYEFLLIEETEQGLRLYVRHFNPGCIAWEAQDAPLALELEDLSADEVVFVSQVDFPQRYTMRRGDGGSLEVLLEGVRDGQPDTLGLEYRRPQD